MLQHRDVTTDVLEQLRASLQGARYSSEAVIAGLVVSLGGALIALTIFSLLRPRYEDIYAPKAKKGVFENPGNNILSWIRPSVVINEEHHARKLGLDAVIFLKSMRMLRNMFTILALLGCTVAIPVNVVFNLRNPWSKGMSKRDAFILTTPCLLNGYPLLAHVLLQYAIVFTVFVCLYQTYLDIIGLRKSHFKNLETQRELPNRTLMVYDLPAEMRSENGLDEFAKQLTTKHGLDGYDVQPTAFSVGHDVVHLNELVAQHKKAILKIEKYSVKYQRRVDKFGIAAAEPIIRRREKGNQKVLAIQYWRSRAQELEDEIQKERYYCQKTHTAKPFGFLSYPSMQSAHRLAHLWKSKRCHRAKVRLAPHPYDLIWENVDLNRAERFAKQCFINVIFTFILLLWIIPNAFIGCFLANLNRLGAIWPAFDHAMVTHKFWFSILQGVLAPLVSTLFFMILPFIMRKLSRWQGKLTRNDREREALRKLYAFFFFDNFIVFTLMGVVWDIIAQAIQLMKENSQEVSFHAVWVNLHVPQRVSNAIVNISSFWVMYLLRANLGVSCELLQSARLLKHSRWLLQHPTPRQKKENESPQPTQFANHYLYPLFYATIALAFTTAQPLILAVLAFYYAISLPLKRYSMMYTFETKYESNGCYWPIVYNVVLLATAFGNVLLFCIVYVGAGWHLAGAIIPLPILCFLFKIYMSVKYEEHFEYFDTLDPEDESAVFFISKMNVVSDRTSLIEDIYENPALYEELEQPMLDNTDAPKAKPHWANSKLSSKNRTLRKFDSQCTLVSPDGLEIRKDM